MQFKTDRVKAEYGRTASAYPGGPLVSAHLLQTLNSIAQYALDIWNWEFELTCLLRTPGENDALYGGKGDHLTGVHVVGRGADIHTLGLMPLTVNTLVDWVNEQLIYDPSRPKMQVALFEGDQPGAGSSAPHLHIQIHPATVNRPKEGPKV